MQTFGTNNFGTFEIYVCPHGQGGQFFAFLFRRFLYTTLYQTVFLLKVSGKLDLFTTV